MDVAEAYMLMFRPTLVPIVGEAWALGFESQIEIHGWNWDMVNQEEVDRREKEDAEIEKQGSLLLGAKPEKTSAEDSANAVIPSAPTGAIGNGNFSTSDVTRNSTYPNPKLSNRPRSCAKIIMPIGASQA